MGRHFFMSEDHPSVVLSDRPPGPRWRELPEKDTQDTAKAMSMSALVLGVAQELARSEQLRRQVFADLKPEPVKSFAEMVSSVMASERISYADACSKVSKERPDLYAEHRAQAFLEG